MSFYFIAHQDDWQVHTGANAYDDLQSGGKVVLVFTTAGNAEKGPEWWMAREEGAKASVKIGVDAGAGGIGASGSQALKSYTSHLIPRWTYGNAVCIFMRLSDGNGDGSGFKEYGNQSLQKLYNEGATMTAIDRSDTYTSWDDLVKTIADIINIESIGMPSRVWHNALGPSRMYSGHSDHEHTAYGLLGGANYAKSSLSIRGQSQSVAFFKGSGRPLPTTPLPPDSGKPKRQALFTAYEDIMRQHFGESGTTTAENPPLILSWVANQDPPQLIDMSQMISSCIPIKNSLLNSKLDTLSSPHSANRFRMFAVKDAEGNINSLNSPEPLMEQRRLLISKL